MEVSFLGTGAAEGYPAMFCSCKNCIEARKTNEMRTRAQVVIDGELSVDFPPEAYYHSVKFGVNLSALKYLLVTHSHMDHFYAHDFILRGYKYAKLEAPVLNIYGNEEIGKVLEECTRRELKEEVKPNFKFNLVHAYEKFDMGDYKVLALPAIHGTKEEALLYYVEGGGKGYLHLYDTGDLSDEAIAFLKQNGAKADLIAFDCTFLDAPRAGLRRHMGVEDNLEIAKRLTAAGVADENTKLVITHFSHNSNPSKERVREVERRYNVIAAHDGLIVKV